MAKWTQKSRVLWDLGKTPRPHLATAHALAAWLKSTNRVTAYGQSPIDLGKLTITD